MDEIEKSEEYLLTFFMEQESLDPDDLSNYDPEEVSDIFPSSRKI